MCFLPPRCLYIFYKYKVVMNCGCFCTTFTIFQFYRYKNVLVFQFYLSVNPLLITHHFFIEKVTV